MAVCSMDNKDEIKKLRAECSELEEQVKLLVKTEMKLKRTQAELIQSKEKIEEYNRKLEQKVEERTIKLNEAVKDLEAFAYSISHDLRMPIRHIDGYVKLMFAKIPQPREPILDYYNKILTSVHRMSVMIDSLLTFSRLGRKELTIRMIDLNPLVCEIIDQFKPDIGMRKILWKISSLPKIKGDINLIKIVFENLISNAIKYTSKKEEAIIEISTTVKSDSQYEIYVKDNGAGFDMAYCDKLFTVFQRLHSADNFEGIGIGLANVKQIIEKHNGSVRAEGKVNEGATFYITIPKNQ